MNEIINKFLAGDKFMPVMHLKQPRRTCNSCEPFFKKQKRIQKLKKATENLRYIYQKKLQ